MVIKGRLCQTELRYKRSYEIRATKFNQMQDIQAYRWLASNAKIKDVLKTIENDDFDNWK
jgi:hypothetical protein